MAKALSPRPPETNDGTITSWLPMATPWQAPSGCASSMWEFFSDALVAWDPGYGISVQTDLSCQPPEVTSWWDADRLGVNTEATQYSIGPVVCPEAYTTVTSSANDRGSTLVGCCPSNYSFKSLKSVGLLDQCQSHLAAGQVVRFATRISSTWVTTTSTMASASAAYAVQINGWLLPEITGVDKETPSTSTPSTTHKPNHTSQTSRSPHSGTESTDTTPTVLPTDQLNALPPTSSSSTSSVSTIGSGKTSDQSTTDTGMGTRIGLGVGIPIGVILIAAIAVALWLRRRRQYPTKIAIASGPIELHGDDRYWAHAASHDKESESLPAELATPVDAVELPAFKEHQPRRWDSQRWGPR